MAELGNMLAALRRALEAGRSSNRTNPRPASVEVPTSAAVRRVELASKFLGEIGRLSADLVSVSGPGEMVRALLRIARGKGARTVAIAEGVATDMRSVAEAVEAAGMMVVRSDAVGKDERASFIDAVERSDLGVAEASYAVASNGTLVVVADPTRPSVITLLPPASVIIVRVERLVADLAEALAALGPETVGSRRVGLIAGPSRTADIEKRIVLGVHGPKSLDVILVWPGEE